MCCLCFKKEKVIPIKSTIYPLNGIKSSSNHKKDLICNLEKPIARNDHKAGTINETTSEKIKDADASDPTKKIVKDADASDPTKKPPVKDIQLDQVNPNTSDIVNISDTDPKRKTQPMHFSDLQFHSLSSYCEADQNKTDKQPIQQDTSLNRESNHRTQNRNVILSQATN